MTIYAIYVQQFSNTVVFLFAPTLSLGMSLRSLPYFKNTFPAGCSGVIPTSSIVKIALVAASTLNYSHAYLITAVNGASSGTVKVL